MLLIKIVGTFSRLGTFNLVGISDTHLIWAKTIYPQVDYNYVPSLDRLVVVDRCYNFC